MRSWIAAAVCRIGSVSAPVPAISAMRSSPGGARCVWFQLSRTAAGSQPQALGDAIDHSSDAGACRPMMSTPQSTTRVSPLLEHDGARLERPARAARATWICRDEAEHRQAERRIERQGGCSCAHQYISKPPLMLIVAPEM